MNDCNRCSLRNAATLECDVFICPDEMPPGDDRDFWIARQSEVRVAPHGVAPLPETECLSNDQMGTRP